MKTVVAFRTFENEQELAESTEIHGPSSGADIYSGQQVKVDLEIVSGGKKYSDLNVYRISPMGIEIDVSSIYQNISIDVGTEISATVTIYKQRCSFAGLMVSKVYSLDGKKIIGIRWVSSTSQEKVSEDRRLAPRWLSGEEFMPTGMAPNPALFNDFIYFKVADISKDGLQLTTSLRNKLLIPNMVLDSTVSFPLVGQVHLKLKVVNARTKTINGKELLSLGVKVLNHEKSSLQVLAQYVLQFGPAISVKELKQHGLVVSSAEDALSFSFVKTAEDYKNVLKFRKTSYSQVGKFDEEKGWEEMGDHYDAKSRIITAHHHGKLVASARVAFHSPDDLTEYDEFVTFPKDFPKKTDMVVASRLCTHPDYRGSDLIYGIMRQIYLVALQANRRYVLGGSSDALLPLYSKLGCKGTGLYFEHGGLNKVKEQIVLGDVTKVLTGESCTFSIWANYFRDLSHYLTNNYDLEIEPKTKIRLAFYEKAAKFKWFLPKD